MIKCVGYYSEEVDEEHYKLIGQVPPEPDLLEAECYLLEPSAKNPIQCVFQLEKDKVLVSYLNGFEVLIRKDKAVIDQLI